MSSRPAAVKNNDDNEVASINREARAKVIAAEGEHKASRALRHAAEVIIECPAAVQVKSSSSSAKC